MQSVSSAKTDNSSLSMNEKEHSINFLNLIGKIIMKIGVISLFFTFIATIDTRTGLAVATASTTPEMQPIKDCFYESVKYDPTIGLLSFTIPKKVPKGYRFYLHVSGRMYMGDKFNGMSFHAFDEESQNYSWKSGKKYTHPLEAENLAECLLIFGLVDKNKHEFLYSIQVSPDGTKCIERTD